MSRRAWTPADDQTMSRIAERGLSYAEAARLLDRAYWAVYHRSRKLGISFTLSKGGPKRNLAREKRVVELASHCLTYAEIAECVSLSRNAVAGILYRYKNREAA